MPFRDAGRHFEDILKSIGYIDEFVSGMSFEVYDADRKTRSAVERELQIITEAAVRLGDDAETICPGVDLEGISRDGEHFASCLPSRGWADCVGYRAERASVDAGGARALEVMRSA